ncbi:ABC transporter ATP-binding protein [Amphibacillus cookii]|uniref:ABC transporter ATP-binding protein n=1 Tax=Amphibacillus cookii TaxID=767787 RepID=UPI0019562C81|nr:ABC transporter ATP-binding protein [Amphibacillus cookii]MBM7542234.1 putative ABC transport system ATP-binding protein/lipoprotein-releasing system ATP-binding protein [Amphibacillus cookii]
MVSKIECVDLTKSYQGDGVETTAVHKLNLCFKRNEFTSVIGRSGSGKSTLLSLLGTLDRPTKGKILYDGEEIGAKSHRRLADFRFEQVGFVFQQFHLLPTLNVLENVLTPLFGRKVSYHKHMRAKEVLDYVDLQDKTTALPSQLSGGQQQRVAIARAIIHKPSWLLVDEPTGNLDSIASERIFNLLKQLHQDDGCGVIFVTHESNLAARTERIITMQDGCVIKDQVGVPL